jgi:hypothetical protein
MEFVKLKWIGEGDVCMCVRFENILCIWTGAYNTEASYSMIKLNRWNFLDNTVLYEASVLYAPAQMHKKLCNVTHTHHLQSRWDTNSDATLKSSGP